MGELQAQRRAAHAAVASRLAASGQHRDSAGDPVGVMPAIEANPPFAQPVAPQMQLQGAPLALSLAASPPAALPPGWEAKFSERRKKYYYYRVDASGRALELGDNGKPKTYWTIPTETGILVTGNNVATSSASATMQPTLGGVPPESAVLKRVQIGGTEFIE